MDNALVRERAFAVQYDFLARPAAATTAAATVATVAISTATNKTLL